MPKIDLTSVHQSTEYDSSGAYPHEQKNGNNLQGPFIYDPRKNKHVTSRGPDDSARMSCADEHPSMVLQTCGTSINESNVCNDQDL